MKPPRCTDREQDVRPPRAFPFFRRAVSWIIFQTFLVPAPENFFANNHPRKGCALLPEKSHCTEYCNLDNPWPPITSFRSRLPWSSSTQTGPEYQRMRRQTKDSK